MQLEGKKHFFDPIEKDIYSIIKSEGRTTPKEVWMYLEAISNQGFELYTTIGESLDSLMIFKRK